MKTSNELFLLIKSMSQSEKRYFKVFSSLHTIGKKNTYVRLFDSIAEQAKNLNEYDEEKIKSLLKEEKFVKKFYSTKNYLYNIVLKSLNSYYSDKTMFSRLSDLIENMEILFRKGMYTQLKKILTKTKRIADENEMFEQWLIILNIERRLIEATKFLIDTERSIGKLYEEKIFVLEKLKNYEILQKIHSNISAIWRKDTVPNSIEMNFLENEVKKNPIFSKEDNALSSRAKLMFYSILFIYHDIHYDDPNVYFYNKKIVELMESPEGKIVLDIGRYIHSLNNLLLFQIYIHKYGEAEENIKKLKMLPLRFPHLKDFSINLFLIFCFVSTGEMLIYFQTGRFDKCLKYASEIEKGLNGFKGKTNKLREIQLKYLISYVYFVTGDYDNSLTRINVILNYNKPDASPELLSYSRILNLMIHFELGNFELIESILKSSYRQLNNSGLYKSEKLMLDLFKKTLQMKSEKEQIDLFSEYKSKLKRLYDDPYEKNSLENLDIISWLESKVLNKSLKDVIRDKIIHTNTL